MLQSFLPYDSVGLTLKGTADRGRGGKTTSGNGQAWSSASPRGQWRTGKMEKTGCKIICGAPTTLAAEGLMMTMMMLCSFFLLLLLPWYSSRRSSRSSSGSKVTVTVKNNGYFSGGGGRKITFLPPELCHPTSSGLMEARAENFTVNIQRVSRST